MQPDGKREHLKSNEISGGTYTLQLLHIEQKRSTLNIKPKWARQNVFLSQHNFDYCEQMILSAHETVSETLDE